jgi:glycosyltransferase involved in cell wall biosynthesis
MVSAIVPVFNQAPYLREAVTSILAQGPGEVIVVDNGSHDDPFAQLEGVPHVAVNIAENAGPSRARNEGAARAQGEILVFLDGDDRLLPGCLESRQAGFRQDSEVGLVFGNGRMVDEHGAFVRQDPPSYPGPFVSIWEAAEKQTCFTLGLAVRKDVYEVVGGFDDSLWVAEDADLLIRIAARWKCVYQTEPLADYRMIPGSSLSQKYGRLIEGYDRQMKKNAPLFDDAARYESIRQETYYRLVRDRVFSRLVKSRGLLGMVGEVSRLRREHPQIGPLFGRYLREKLLRAKA